MNSIDKIKYTNALAPAVQAQDKGAEKCAVIYRIPGEPYLMACLYVIRHSIH